jgi:DNA-binding transcriptional LysR family regulator
MLNPLDGLGDSYRTEPLYTERYVVLLPPEHALGARNAVALRELSEQPYVDRLSCEMREMVMAVCNDTDVKLYARFRSERLGAGHGHGQCRLRLHAGIFRHPSR